MLNFIVLGQVPGTKLQIGFIAAMLMIAISLIGLLVKIHNKHLDQIVQSRDDISKKIFRLSS